LFLTYSYKAKIAACFDREDGSEFDYVFNFAAETKYSQVPEIYQERIFNLSVNCAKEAAKRNVKLFVEMSTAEVYDSNQVKRIRIKKKKKKKKKTVLKKWIRKLRLKQARFILGLSLLNTSTRQRKN
jgi:nucleoside-diphosphate-sugar epimerase